MEAAITAKQRKLIKKYKKNEEGIYFKDMDVIQVLELIHGYSNGVLKFDMDNETFNEFVAWNRTSHMHREKKLKKKIAEPQCNFEEHGNGFKIMWKFT